MTLSEFKSWLEGFKHSFEHQPSREQWELIVQKLDSVTEQPPITFSPTNPHLYFTPDDLIPKYINCYCISTSNGTSVQLLNE